MRDRKTTPETQQRSPLMWMRWVPAALLALVTLAALIVGGRVILVPLLSSLALAYLLAPVVAWFERRGWARTTSAMLTMTAATLALALALIFIVPSLWNQVGKSYAQARELFDDPQRRQQVTDRIKQINPQFYDLVKTQIERNKGADVGGFAATWLRSGLFKLVDLTASILDLLLIPFFVFYFLADYGEMRTRMDRLIPLRYRGVAAGLFAQINHVISSYIRSQLVIALAMGALYSLGFLALHVPMAVTIGMLSGLLNFVPYLGTLTGIVLSLAFAALDGAGLGKLVGVLSVFAIVQSIEGYYLTPKLLGSRLDLHPLWVLIGLMVGGNLFGLLGIILAVPVIAIAKVVLGFLEDLYQQSDFYRAAGVNLLTDQGHPVEFLESAASESKLLIDANATDSPRRTIITTTELRSRIREDPPSSED